MLAASARLLTASVRICSHPVRIVIFGKPLVRSGWLGSSRKMREIFLFACRWSEGGLGADRGSSKRRAFHLLANVLEVTAAFGGGFVCVGRVHVLFPFCC